ncbi:MAG: hypothetical protein ACAH80_16685 [Alphaproteobacteria bacterium]
MAENKKPHIPPHKHDPNAGILLDKHRWTKKQLLNDICAVVIAAVSTSFAASAVFHLTTKSQIWITPFFISIIPNLALLGLAATLNARGQRWGEYNKRRAERGIAHGITLYIIGLALVLGFYGWYAAAYFSSAAFVAVMNSLWLIPISLVFGVVAIQLMCRLRTIGSFLPFLTVALVFCCLFSGKKYALDDIQSTYKAMRRIMTHQMSWSDTMDIGMGTPP